MSDICIATNPTSLVVACVALVASGVIALVRSILLRSRSPERAPSVWSVNVLLFFTAGLFMATSLSCIRL